MTTLCEARLRTWCFLCCASILTLPSQANADLSQQGKALFEVGAQAYAAGDYRSAIEAFDEAYRREARPGLLFSLGQAHRRAYLKTNERENLLAAIRNYRRYLEEMPAGGRRNEALDALNALERAAARLERTEPARTQNTPNLARLMIACRAPGAVLAIDGEIAPGLPYVASITPGSHKIALSAKGFEPYVQTIEVPATGVVALNIELKELPAKLAVSGPEGAEVLVDGRFVGWLPLQPFQVGAGAHRVSLRKSGYQLAERDLTLESGETASVNLTLETTAQRDLSKVLMITSLVGIGTTAGLTAVAFVYDRDAKATSDAWQARGGFTPERASEYRDTRNRRDDFRTASIIVGSASAAVGITGLVLYFVDQPQKPSTSAPEKAPTPQTPTLDLVATAGLTPSDLLLELRGNF